MLQLRYQTEVGHLRLKCMCHSCHKRNSPQLWGIVCDSYCNSLSPPRFTSAGDVTASAVILLLVPFDSPVPGVVAFHGIR